MQAGPLAGGTLLRQPGKSTFVSGYKEGVDGLRELGGGIRPGEQVPCQQEVSPAGSPLAVLVRDHATVDAGLQGILAGLKGFNE